LTAVLLPAIIAVLGAWLGFANPFVQVPLAALLLPVGLSLLALSAGSGGAAFRRGLIVGGLAYAGGLYWIALPIHDYGYLPWIVAVPCPLLLAAFIGLFSGAYTYVLKCCGRNLGPLTVGLLAGGLWGSLEWLREFFLTGFPWLSLASSLSAWPVLVQGAAYTGGIGLGAVLTAAAVWLIRGPGLFGPPRLAGIAVLAGLFLLGLFRLDQAPEPGPEAGISVVQGNVDQSLKWDAAYQAATVERYLSLSAGEVARHAPRLVVWPETAMPFYLQDVGELTALVKGFAREHGVAVLTGAPAYFLKDPKAEPELYNRAFLVGPEGSLAGYYDKTHLVPFGEYVPFRLSEFLPIGKLVQGVGDFRAGRQLAPLTADGLAMGVLICYETIFTELAQERVARGANVLVNISNDAWFGRSSAPRQHLQLSVLRAVEQGRWLVRATNTGISAFIDDRGRINEATALFVTTTAFHQVRLYSETTVFHRFYAAIRWGLPLATLALALAGLAARRRPAGRL